MRLDGDSGVWRQRYGLRVLCSRDWYREALAPVQLVAVIPLRVQVPQTEHADGHPQRSGRVRIGRVRGRTVNDGHAEGGGSAGPVAAILRTF